MADGLTAAQRRIRRAKDYHSDFPSFNNGSLFKFVKRSNGTLEKVPVDWKTFKSEDKWKNIVLPPIDLLAKAIDELTLEDFYDADFELVRWTPEVRGGIASQSELQLFPSAQPLYGLALSQRDYYNHYNFPGQLPKCPRCKKHGLVGEGWCQFLRPFEGVGHEGGIIYSRFKHVKCVEAQGKCLSMLARLLCCPGT